MRRVLGSAPVVIDDLDIVPVRVEHERAVIAGVVDPSLTWGAVVRIAGGESGPVKGVDRLVLRRRERNVKRFGRPAADDGEGTVSTRELRTIRSGASEAEAGVRRDLVVERLRCSYIGDADPEMVDPSSRTQRTVVDGLDAVAVRVEEKGSVVILAVLRARAWCAVVLVTGLRPDPPEGRCVLRGGCDEADVEAARDGLLLTGETQ